MRENMGDYRGKTLDGEKWVYGSLIVFKDCLYEATAILEEPCCGTAMCMDECFGNMITDVDPSTVGECTGLSDKNGKEIYEEDRVRFKQYTNEYIGTITYRRGCFVIAWTGQCGEFHSVFMHLVEDIEVIGNIHDKEA